MIKKKVKKRSKITNIISSKKQKKKKTNYWLIVIAILVIAILIGIFVLLGKNKKEDILETSVIETSKTAIAVESQKNNEEKDEPEEDEVKYTLNDFAEMLKEHGSQVSIKEINSNTDKKYKCLIATSKAIYEDFEGLDFISPNIVMNAVGFEGEDILVTAKRLASDIKTVYCNWNAGNNCYQVITLDSIDIGDFLNAIYNYIMTNC